MLRDSAINGKTVISLAVDDQGLIRLWMPSKYLLPDQDGERLMG